MAGALVGAVNSKQPLRLQRAAWQLLGYLASETVSNPMVRNMSTGGDQDLAHRNVVIRLRTMNSVQN